MSLTDHDILPRGATLHSGKRREGFGELEGRVYKPVMVDESKESATDCAKVEWVVEARKGTKVKLTAKHDRAGVVKLEIVLK